MTTFLIIGLALTGLGVLLYIQQSSSSSSSSDTAQSDQASEE